MSLLWLSVWAVSCRVRLPSQKLNRGGPERHRQLPMLDSTRWGCLCELKVTHGSDSWTERRSDDDKVMQERSARGEGSQPWRSRSTAQTVSVDLQPTGDPTEVCVSIGPGRPAPSLRCARFARGPAGPPAESGSAPCGGKRSGSTDSAFGSWNTQNHKVSILIIRFQPLSERKTLTEVWIQ